MEWMLTVLAGGTALLLGHGMVVVVYTLIRAHGPGAAVRRRLETYVAGGK